MHEIITLQLGQRSNYVATHFWNLQESYFTYNEGEESPVNHDVHFRPGLGADGTETFTPRTIIYDLKGGFGSLKKYNALYQMEEESSMPRGLWDGNEVIQQQPQIPQSEYQKSLDLGLTPPPLTSETVRYWSDFNRVFYHPRSIVQLNDYELNSRLMPFENWEVGEELFKDLDKEHDLLDRDVRPFAEECDQLRALQIFSGTDDAWGGFSARYIDRLRDEYGKTSIWLWGLEDGAKVQRQKQILRSINVAKSISAISPQVSLYTPIMDPPHPLPTYLNIDLQSEWYKSALITSAIESATLPSRLRQYHDIEAALAGDDGTHRIFELKASIVPEASENPAGSSRTEAETAGSLSEDDGIDENAKFDINFSCIDPAGRHHTFNEIQVARGFEFARADEPWLENSTLARRQRLFNSQSTLQRFNTGLRLPILDSFPRNLFADSRPEAGIKVHAALAATSAVADRIKALQAIAGRAVGVDEREALVNGLGEIRETYEQGWMSDLDSGEDD
ncbi:hypothetical protein DTO212C5_7182 [Paecilomyces variotii]|nr:hypothetical protein DTO212C5_7182 [Paecilomyces variotii]